MPQDCPPELVNPDSSGGGGWQEIPPNVVPQPESEILPYLKEMLPKILAKIPTPQQIVDPLLDFFRGVFGDAGSPLDLPELDQPEFDFPLDSVILDTIPFDTTEILPWELDSVPIEEFLDKVKALLDSLPLPFNDTIPNEEDTIPKPPIDSAFVETIVEKFKEMFEEVQEKVSENLEPLTNLMSSGGGGCNCFTSSFIGLNFSGVTVSAPSWALALICDNLAVIKRMLLLMAIVISLGMVLAFLRGN